MDGNLLGESIIKARKELGIKQKDLAKELNIAVTTLRSYEKGLNKPNNQSLMKLNERLGIDLIDINKTVTDESKIGSMLSICRTFGYNIKNLSINHGIYEIQDDVKTIISIKDWCLKEIYCEIEFKLLKSLELLANITIPIKLSENVIELKDDTSFGFGKNLKQIRKSNNINQKDFACYLGISLRSLNYYETGSHSPSFDIASRINANLKDLISRGIIKYNSIVSDPIMLIIKSFKIYSEIYLDNETNKRYIKIKSPNNDKWIVTEENKFKYIFESFLNEVRYIVKDKLKSAEKNKIN